MKYWEARQLRRIAVDEYYKLEIARKVTYIKGDRKYEGLLVMSEGEVQIKMDNGKYYILVYSGDKDGEKIYNLTIH